MRSPSRISSLGEEQRSGVNMQGLTHLYMPVDFSIDSRMKQREPVGLFMHIPPGIKQSP